MEKHISVLVLSFVEEKLPVACQEVNVDYNENVVETIVNNVNNSRTFYSSSKISDIEDAVENAIEEWKEEN